MFFDMPLSGFAAGFIDFYPHDCIIINMFHMLKDRMH